MLREETDFDIAKLMENVNSKLPILNPEQRFVCDKVLRSMQHEEGNLFFYLHDKNNIGSSTLKAKIALSTAMCGIAAAYFIPCARFPSQSRINNHVASAEGMQLEN